MTEELSNPLITTQRKTKRTYCTRAERALSAHCVVRQKPVTRKLSKNPNIAKSEKIL